MPIRPTVSITSSTLVTSTACCSRSSSWQPTDIAEVIGPGTAITGLPSTAASRAVRCAPLRPPASTTTVPAPSAAISRLRTRNRCRAGMARAGTR